MSRVLIARFSSFGDVALLVPVVSSVAIAYPQVHFTVMTKNSFVQMFEQLNFNVSVIGIDVDRSNGFVSLVKIISKTCGFKFTHLADEHNVIRTRIMRLFMPFFYTKRKTLDKGRMEKTAMIESKITQPPLKSTTQRYLDVFIKLGFDKAKLNFTSIFEFQTNNINYLSGIAPQKVGKWIGIAPFSKHDGKTLPFAKIEQLVSVLTNYPDTTLFLFGAGKKEMHKVEKLSKQFPDKVILLDRMRLKRELILISHLDLMVSMDSANMHLASICNVPVVSVWGATHPSLGFYGYNQDLDNVVQVDLPCRPCSVYGENPCQFSGDKEYQCLKSINIEDILSKINRIIYRS